MEESGCGCHEEATLLVPSKRAQCCKCGEVPPAVRSGALRDLCGPCLSSSVMKKFKGNIRVKLGLKSYNSCVVVAVSGGSGSMSALDLFVKCITENNRKKMLFRVIVVHVDEMDLFGRQESDEQALESLTDAVRLITAELDACEYVPLPLFRDDEEAAAVREAMSSLADPSEEEDVLKVLRYRCISSYVKEHVPECCMVLLGSTADRLAIEALADTAKARGARAPGLVQYVHTQYDVSFGYPLRDTLSKDIGLYAHLQGIRTVSMSQLLSTRRVSKTRNGDRSEGLGISHVTERFVVELQSKFSNTVPNILKTFSKLETYDDSRRCSVCTTPVDNGRVCHACLSQFTALDHMETLFHSVR